MREEADTEADDGTDVDADTGAVVEMEVVSPEDAEVATEVKGADSDDALGTGTEIEELTGTEGWAAEKEAEASDNTDDPLLEEDDAKFDELCDADVSIGAVCGRDVFVADDNEGSNGELAGGDEAVSDVVGELDAAEGMEAVD